MIENTYTQPTILRLPDVLRMVGLSRPHVYRMIRAGEFPQQVRLSPGAVGWLRSEVEGWLAGRVSARDVAAGKLAA